MDNFEKLIDLIIKDAGLDGMPEEFLVEYRLKMKEEAEKALGLRAMQALSPEQIEEFNDLVIANPGETEMIQKYLQDNIENFDTVMAEALDEFRDRVIETATELSK